MSEVETNNKTAKAVADSSEVKCADNTHFEDLSEKSVHSNSEQFLSTTASENDQQSCGETAETSSKKEGAKEITNGASTKLEPEDATTQSKFQKATEDQAKNPDDDALCKEVSNLILESCEHAQKGAEIVQDTSSSEHPDLSEQQVPAGSPNVKKEAISQDSSQSAKITAANSTVEEDNLSESDGQTPANQETHKEAVDSADDDYEEDEEKEEEDGDDEGNDEEEGDLDEDQIKSSPAYIPKHGNFYMHDVRGSNAGGGTALRPEDKQSEEDEEEQEEANKSSLRAGIRSRADRKWEHDLFDDRQQKPKDPKELVRKYGKNIRKTESKERDEVGEEPEQHAKRFSNTSTQSSNDRSKPAGVRGDRRAPPPVRNQPFRDRPQRRVQATRVSPTYQREQHLQAGGRRTTFVSSTHRPAPPQNGGPPAHQRYTNQEEGYRRRQTGDYHQDKFVPRNNQQQRYGRSNTDQQQQGGEYSSQQYPAVRYHQEEQESRKSNRGARRYTSQRHATAPANGYSSGGGNNNHQQQQAQPQLRQKVVEEEWGRAGPQDWGDGNNDDWARAGPQDWGEGKKGEWASSTSQTVDKSNFTPLPSQPEAPVGIQHEGQQGYFPPHNPHAQRFQPRYSQQQLMRTDITPSTYSQQRGGRATGAPQYAVPPPEGPQYPHPRQPTDAVYFHPPPGHVIYAQPMVVGGNHQQPARERRRLNIAPPTAGSHQFSN